MKKVFWKKNKGYTLIEIMIVITIIVLISAIILSYVGAARAKGRDAIRIADIKQVEQSLEVYFSNCNSYPNSLSQLTTTSSCNLSPALPVLPTDPQNHSSYSYYLAVSSNSVAFHLCSTNMELGTANIQGKSSAPRLDPNADPCDGTLGNTYDRKGP